MVTIKQKTISNQYFIVKVTILSENCLH